MIKDIFIDADVASKIHCDSKEYVDFTNWLNTFNEADKDNCAHLVVSQKLIQDWFGRPGGNDSSNKNCIASIYEKLNSEDRLIKISNKQIKDFIDEYFKDKWDEITCKRKNSNDHFHIAAVYLSNRRMALTQDQKLKYDLENVKFKKLRKDVQVGEKPSDLNYT